MRFSVIFLVTLLICGSCEKKSVTGTFPRGTAINMQDQNPIPSAFLVLGEELLAATDATGAFEITTLDPDTYPLRISSPGYQDMMQIVRVEPDRRIYASFILSKQ